MTALSASATNGMRGSTGRVPVRHQDGLGLLCRPQGQVQADQALGQGVPVRRHRPLHGTYACVAGRQLGQVSVSTEAGSGIWDRGGQGLLDRQVFMRWGPVNPVDLAWAGEVGQPAGMR